MDLTPPCKLIEVKGFLKKKPQLEGPLARTMHNPG